MHGAFSLLSRSYDLRGIYPEQINEAFYYQLGFALAKWAPEGKITIGGDARVSTPSLMKACICGLEQGGRQIIELGLLSSDMLQFSSIFLREEIGLAIMITASHNPKEYNGLKMCLKNAGPINLKAIAPELVDIIEKTPEIEENTNKAEQSGWKTQTTEKRDILSAWIERLSGFTMSDASELKIVADAGNGTAGVFMPALSEKLGFELVPLFFEPDGNFPNHHPSPIESKNMQDLLEKVKATQADVGVAFDGDADRAVLCDENGEIISSSVIISAISELFLLEQPNKKILVNAVVSKGVEETVHSLGGQVIYEKVGHIYIKEQMAKNPDIIFAGEHSSHFFFPALGNMDSGVVAFVLFLEYMAQFEMKASEVREKFTKYIAIEETNFRVTDPKKALEHISTVFSDHEQQRLDGLTLIGDGYWCNFRMSSNEPLLRLNMEAKNIKLLEEVKNRMIQELSLFHIA